MVDVEEHGLGWVLEPLLGAGLSTDQASDLVFRLAFDAVVDDVRGVRVSAPGALADQPCAVRTAWEQTLLRMMLVDPLRQDGAGGGLATAGG
ncbi:hypothetical protein [Modestobacter roseus]|uniref:hypothetical protein n=1 Tax=Modestobacter roseus TaxID=1181884 RepID=UPI0034DEF140